jgi:hypothetical protein
MKIRLVACLIMGFVASVSGEVDARQQYAGESGCEPEFKWAPGTYTVRLDGAQRSSLAAHTVGEANVLTILQFKGGGDQCGVIRDAVRSEKADDFFEFDCIDRRKPEAVVVGTRPGNDHKISGRAMQAWEVDLKTLRFVPDDRKEVTCVRRNYSGNDDGDDLATWARKRERSNRPIPIELKPGTGGADTNLLQRNGWRLLKPSSINDCEAIHSNVG